MTRTTIQDKLDTWGLFLGFPVRDPGTNPSNVYDTICDLWARSQDRVATMVGATGEMTQDGVTGAFSYVGGQVPVAEGLDSTAGSIFAVVPGSYSGSASTTGPGFAFIFPAANYVTSDGDSVSDVAGGKQITFTDSLTFSVIVPSVGAYTQVAASAPTSGIPPTTPDTTWSLTCDAADDLELVWPGTPPPEKTIRNQIDFRYAATHAYFASTPA